MIPMFPIIFIIAIVIAVFLVSIIIYNLHRQKKAERLQSAFEKSAAGFGLTLTEQSIVANMAIGLDKTKKKLLFLELTGEKQNRHLVNLSEVKSSSVVKTYALLKRSRVSLDEIIKTISLQFNFDDADKTLLLPFYNKEIDATTEMKERTKLAEYWQKLIAGHLSKISGVSVKDVRRYPEHKLFYIASLK